MSTCSDCKYWKPRNGNKETSYSGYCSYHMMIIEFNFICKDFDNNTLEIGNILSPAKLNGRIGYHPSVDMYNGLSKEEYFKDTK